MLVFGFIRHQSKGLSLSAGGQNMPDVVEVITKLAANFTKLIELMLSKEIKVSNLGKLISKKLLRFQCLLEGFKIYFTRSYGQQ